MSSGNRVRASAAAAASSCRIAWPADVAHGGAYVVADSPTGRAQHDLPQPASEFGRRAAAEAREVAVRLQEGILDQVGVVQPGLEPSVVERPDQDAQVGTVAL
jgi:hypothetical protein